MERNVVLIQIPEDTEGGAYGLIVSRGSNPFGPSGSALFYIDYTSPTIDSSGRVFGIQAWRGSRDPMTHLQTPGTVLVTEFPAGTPYILVDRKQLKVCTSLDMALQQKAEQEEMEAALPTPTETEKNGNIAEGHELHTGHYV